MALLKTSNGAVFVQTGGANSQPRFVGCVDVDTITESGGDIDELIRCFRPDGQGWQTLSSTVTPPDPVTTKVTTFVDSVASYFEQLRAGEATLFFHQRDGGRADTFGNFVRSFVLEKARVGERTIDDIANKDEDNPTMQGYSVSAPPPVWRVYQKSVARKTTSEAGSITKVHFCGTGADLCQVGFASTKFVTSASADVLYTTDAGATWTIGSADPFATSEDIQGVTCFQIGRSTTRVVVALGTTRAGGPMVVAYSDNYGAAWTVVTVGSTNAQYAKGPNALFAYDPYNMWVVVGGGYIYKSTDAGVTWSTQDAGVTTTSDYYAVHFATDRVGAAVGAAGAVAVTQDGGATWTLKTAPASTVLNAVHVIDSDHMWVAGANGRIYYTTDGGTTWASRDFANAGTGSVSAIRFAPYSTLFGIMVWNSTGPVGTVYTTIDGGFTWTAETTPTNSGLNGVFACDANNYWVAGNVNSGTGVLLKVSPKS